MTKTPEIITVPPGTEINCGLSEDSDSVVANAPTQLLVVGLVANGVLPVRIIENGKPNDQIFYHHQPEPKSPKP